MRAATYQELFDFETAFESATVAALAAAGIGATGTSGSAVETGTTVGVALQLGEGSELIRTPDNGLCHARFSASLVVEILIPRLDDEPSTVAQVRAQARAALRQRLDPFNVTRLPFYQVVSMTPSSTRLSQTEDRLADVVALTFAITFAIRTDAWPIT